MQDFLETNGLWLVAVICFIIGSGLIFIEYQYNTKGSYAIAKIERLWWVESEESDTYKVTYSYIDSLGNENTGNHSIDINLWNRLDEGSETLPMVQYIEGSRNRLLGKTGWLWVFIWIGAGLSAILYKLFNDSDNNKKTR